MSKISVVVVDDHAVLRDGIRAILDLQHDLEIVGEASDGKEAIAVLGETWPDVVIMDLAMEGMDGVEATRRIKKQFPRIKVLVLSQYEDKEYILSAIRAGASGYIPKKALGSDLVAAIRSVYSGNSVLYPSATTVLINDYIRQAKPEPFDSLTDREREVLKMIADGYTSKEIAAKLFISIKTVLGHRTKIMEKLDIHNRAELIKFAVRKGLIKLDT